MSAALSPLRTARAEGAAWIASGALSVEELARGLRWRAQTGWNRWSGSLPGSAITRFCAARGLHGLMLAINDMIDTADMPGQDAAVVAIYRAEEVLILGKADTREFASGGRLAASRTKGVRGGAGPFPRNRPRHG